ncbi:unnamed protein product [Chrysoparadoxa australica]
MEITVGMFDNEFYYYYLELLVMGAIVAVATFAFTEAYHCLAPSMVMSWCPFVLWSVACVAAWCVPNLNLMLGLGENSFEADAGYCAGLMGFFASLGITSLIPVSVLDADVSTGLESLHEVWPTLTEIVSGERTYLLGLGRDDFTVFCRIMLGIVAGVLASGCPMPALRFSHSFSHMVRPQYGCSVFRKALLWLDLLGPIICATMWVPTLSHTAVEHFFPDVSLSAWRKARVLVSVSLALLKMALVKPHLQTFMEQTTRRIVLKELAKDKVEAKPVQEQFTCRIQYLVIAAAQYVAPVVVILMLALLLINKASSSYDYGMCSTLRSAVGKAVEAQDFSNEVGSVPESAAGVLPMLKALRTMDIIPQQLYEGVLSFLLWWCWTWWSACYVAGVAYWQVYPDEVSLPDPPKKDRTTKSKKQKVSKKER